MTNRPGPRFQMWIDAVGGYLVCLSDEILIGQAIPESVADVPIFGDLSRRHAVLRREGESYVIVPHAKTLVEQQAIDGSRYLRDGDELQFGASVSMRFRQPHPLSHSCRLEFTSPHRTQPHADAVVVLANSCVLGPSETSHVVCRHWTRDLVLAREGQDLRCHTAGVMEVDGKDVKQKSAINLNSRICGEDFCVSLEQIN
ncbi:MAG: FHA domain-containing protein [Planctomycetales bacterium]|nr:FHA domain-containing protein [Planctomycetales bacterium]